MKFAMRRARYSAALMAVVGVAALLAGCGEALPPSGPHAATLPEQVTIYQNKPPKKYEVLGTINLPITADMKWDERGDSTAGFEALKAKAAALGANGLLLKVDDHSLYDVDVGVGYKNVFYTVPLRREPKTALATAIFVLN